MAAVSGKYAVVGSVTNAQIDTITLTGSGKSCVISVRNSENLWVRFDGVDPTAGGAAENFVILGKGARVFQYNAGATIKVTGDTITAATYCIELQPL